MNLGSWFLDGHMTEDYDYGCARCFVPGDVRHFYESRAIFVCRDITNPGCDWFLYIDEDNTLQFDVFEYISMPWFIGYIRKLL